MPSAEIIAIGSELLLGDTLDTNTQFLLQNFRKLGIDVFRTMIIGDNAKRISEVIREALSRADIVITTGGLGPTIDDPTRGAAAMALDCDLVFRPELWEEICAYIGKFGRKPTLNNKKQAYIPSTAEPISNPTGTAPAFCVYREGNLLVSLPGVPKEMKYLFTNSVIPILDRYFHVSGAIVMHNLHTFGIGESALDEIVGELEKTANPTLGLCAKMGQIDLRITAKADTADEAEKAAAAYERIILEKLGDSVYGKDEETLLSVVKDQILKRNVRLRLLEVNTSGLLCNAFDDEFAPEKHVISTGYPEEEIGAFLAEGESGTLSAALSVDPGKSDFIHADVYIRFRGAAKHYTRSYNYLTADENDWLQWTLNAIRLSLIEQQMPENRK